MEVDNVNNENALNELCYNFEDFTGQLNSSPNVDFTGSSDLIADHTWINELDHNTVSWLTNDDVNLENSGLSDYNDPTTLNYSYYPSDLLSTSPSYLPSTTVSTLPLTPAATLPHDMLSVSSSLSSPAQSPSISPSLSQDSPSPSIFSHETDSTTISDDWVALKDNEARRDIELLNLFESTVFNRLLEDNFIQLNLQEERLSIESGLRQFEYKKYHELAKISDILHENRDAALERTEPVDKFQINIIQKHTEKLIAAVKKITSFTNLCLDDQISLLKSRFLDLCIIKSIIFVEPETRSIKINGQKISMERCSMMNDNMFIELTASIHPILRSDPLINLLILILCLLNPNSASLRSSYAVRKEYFITVHLVQKYLEIRGFSILEANYEIKKLICNLENFLLLFNARKKIQDIVKRHLGYTSQLITEMLDINGQ
ncbi:uncharacterized protein LOC107366775 [Tetranychus urticae]|uniref:Uncharacterized protein n=1 Tax=Tetranychus urticae TaxID=32264 RepID=T1KRX4_TETUR|nr:uncharacterized protein LOC107366775 [Tetranychus urticae]